MHDDVNGFGKAGQLDAAPTDDQLVDEENSGDDFDLGPIVRKQNTCCVLAFISLMLSLSIFVVFKGYNSPYETDVATTLHEAESGTVGSEVWDNETKQFNWNNKIDRPSDGDKWTGSYGKVGPSNPDQSKFKNGGAMMPGGSATSGHAKFDLEKWASSTVTLDDGPMFEVIKELKHDGEAFVEGLAFYQNELYESTGLYQDSTIRKLDQETGEIIESHQMGKQYFGEGLTIANGKAIQLTYRRKTGFKYDLSDLSQTPEKFQFSSTTGEGWGLTYRRRQNELVMSDGSEYLHFWDGDTMEELRKVKVVRQKGRKSDQINELEHWHGRILANIWHEDTICVINPKTGEVEKEYDFSTLWPKKERREKGAGVLNGISKSADPNHVYVTGKNWNRMFLVRLKF